jgi:biotin carboxyl carrier protein
MMTKDRRFRISLDDNEFEVHVREEGSVGGEFSLEDITPKVKIEDDLIVKVFDEEFKLRIEDFEKVSEIGIEARPSEVETVPKPEVAPEFKRAEEIEGYPVKAPMPGVVIRIPVSIGDKVNRGDVVAVLESMKMENNIESPVSGVVKAINVSVGATVAQGDSILIIG